MPYLMKYTIWRINKMPIYTEENNVYKINCTNAVWSTDNVHEDFVCTESCLNDVDFIIESKDKLLLVEYKNANVPNAAHPGAFNPKDDKKVKSVIKKYYDSLHYLTLVNKNKPKTYIYILEYPNGDSVTRKALRNRMKKALPFRLQSKFDTGIKLIDKFEILSIEEWNNSAEYGKYPISPIDNEF